MARRRRPGGGGSGGGGGGSGPEGKGEKPQQRNAANARERARMRVLSRAFCRLKTTLPWVPADTKLSKLDTLRLATSYIAHLRAVLADEPSAAPLHPLNLTWPFSFHHQQPNQGGHPSSGAGRTAPAGAGAASLAWGGDDGRASDDGCSTSSASSSCPDGDLDDDTGPPGTAHPSPPGPPPPCYLGAPHPPLPHGHHYADGFLHLT